MKAVISRGMCLLLLLLILGSAHAQITSFQHIVLIVQENRTPDNLFQGLCLPPYGRASACGTSANQFNIRNYGLDKEGTPIPLSPIALGNSYTPEHAHSNFEAMCNPNKTTYYPCSQNTRLSTAGCPKSCSFQYVDPNQSPGVYSYLYIAQNFGWANLMFQTNQGPSAPAHQFLFGGTAAPTAADDANALFLADNPDGLGCLSPLNVTFDLIDPVHAPGTLSVKNNPLGTQCFSHETMASLLESRDLTWRYYTMGDPKSHISNSIWTAPNSIEEICQPNSTFTECVGPDWTNNVDLNPAHVLTDLNTCQLKNMVWVIPIGQNSDHPGLTTNDGGPAWVASIINGISSSACTDTIDDVQVPYWKDTAVIVIWDDWGGFYDHVLPPFLSAPNEGQGDYQLGFRVPLLFISAYTGATVDSINQYDFGSILRFVEHNFGFSEGALGFADARSTTDLSRFYNFRQLPKNFPIPTTVPADFFLNDQRTPEPPDDD